MTKQTLIVIPSRYQSSRFPGKPLAMIAGKFMIQRVYDIASRAAANFDHCQVVIATDDTRIEQAARSFNAPVVMTASELATGTDRVLAACQQLQQDIDIVINLQGDAPLTPPHFIQALIETLQQQTIDVATPYIRLTWQELDLLRERKLTTPMSGTTLIMDQQQRALWFSKNIIPAIRHEDTLRQQSELSPILGHVGLYGYTVSALERYINLPESHYETLEGLEQLRWLENGISIQGVEVSYHGLPSMSGVDTPIDAQRVEQIILQHGELYGD